MPPVQTNPIATRCQRTAKLFLLAAVGMLGWFALRADGQSAPPLEPTPRPTSRPASRPTTLPAFIGRSGQFDARPVPRDELTVSEYERQAIELRAAYAKPSAEWPKPVLMDGVPHVELGRMPSPTFPSDNPYSKAKAQLGIKLFMDPKLSGSGQIACISCHDPELGWADGRTTSFGHDRQSLKRNAPTLLNAASLKQLFWDGRAASLEDQAVEPLFNDAEMHGTSSDVLKRLNETPEYVRSFKDVFGIDRIELEHVTKALATFQRTIVSGRSKFDRFLAGAHDALGDDAVRGLHLFRTTANCLNCHNGSNFTDGQFHDVGLSYYGRKLQDLGRYEVTKKPADVGAFRTPSLRNVGRTSPYMHNGLFEMDGLLNLYNAGMPTLKPRPAQVDDPLFPKKSHLLKPLGLNKRDLADLKAFMESLSEPRLRVRALEVAASATQPSTGPSRTPDADGE